MGVIQKRGDNYRVLIRKAGMPSISKTFPKKALAQAFMVETEANIAKGHYREDKTSLGWCIDQYVKEYGPFDRDKDEKLTTLRKDLGQKTLKELDSSALISYANYLSKSGVKGFRKPSTVKGFMVRLGQTLKVAEAAFDCKPKLDDFDKAMIFLKGQKVIGTSDERERRTTDDEIARVLSFAKTSLPLQDLVRFQVVTAMRRGETLSLLWKELGDDGKTIGIWRKHPDQGKRYVRVPLLPEAVALIQKQSKVSERIFPYTPVSISSAWKRAVAAAGVEDLRWHDLRHEGCSRLFEMGLDIMTVALFSGHRDMNMLRRYTHLNAKTVLESLEPQLADPDTSGPSANLVVGPWSASGAGTS